MGYIFLINVYLKNLDFFNIKNFSIILAEEIMESEEEEDSAVAFKKAGSEASEPDLTKFKVFITSRFCY